MPNTTEVLVTSSDARLKQLVVRRERPSREGKVLGTDA